MTLNRPNHWVLLEAMTMPAHEHDGFGLSPAEAIFLQRARVWSVRLAAAFEIALVVLIVTGAWSHPAGAGDKVADAAIGIQAEASALDYEAKPDLWIVTIGGWGGLQPTYEGSRHHEYAWRPYFNVRKSDAREWIALPNDGFDFELIETDNFRAGPVVNWRWIRDVGASAPRGFRRFGTVDFSVEGGAFAEFWPVTWVRTRLEVRDALFGASGFVADASSDFVWRPDAKWRLTGGPRISFADSSYMKSYYSVTVNQAAISGLPTYAAHAGLRAYGGGAGAQYKLSDNWTTMSFFEYQRLADAVEDSPLLTARRGTREQFTVGLGITYSFGIER